MASWFRVTLDTTAPHVTWGAVGGATAGDTLVVMYATDEPLASAKLRLPDGRVLDMAVGSDRLTVVLPPDTPDGNSWITVADDVGNAAPRQAVYISGTIVVPPPEPPALGGGFPARRFQAETRVVRSRSRAVAHATTRTERRRRAHARGLLTSRFMIHDSWIVKARAEARSTTRTSTRRAARSSFTSPEVTAVIRRRDDPGEEATLLALGVL